MLIISPYSKTMRNGKENPKNYPWWPEVIQSIQSEIVQIGVGNEPVFAGTKPMFNKTLDELAVLVKECQTWISVDNFFPHLAHHYNKPGVVIFGRSDPMRFGYKENKNLLKDRKYLREKQFDIWEVIKHTNECFVPPKEVVNNVRTILQQGVSL